MTSRKGATMQEERREGEELKNGGPKGEMRCIQEEKAKPIKEKREQGPKNIRWDRSERKTWRARKKNVAGRRRVALQWGSRGHKPRACDNRRSHSKSPSGGEKSRRLSTHGRSGLTVDGQLTSAKGKFHEKSMREPDLKKREKRVVKKE